MKTSPLRKNHFQPLPLGSIKPEGWLKNQLRIQADGLSGHLDEFWPDIKDSKWFGGQAEGWERAPYWLDGLIPLAFLLNDPVLKKKTNTYVDYIVRHQNNGWLGPEPEDYATYDIWALFLVLKVLIQYREAAADERIVETVEKCLRRIDSHIDVAPLTNWGQFRWFEALLATHWLHDITGESWLLELGLKFRTQGFDWASFFEYWPITGPTPKHRWNYMGHVVNNAMAIKAHALWWKQSEKEEDFALPYRMIEKLERHHGTAIGVFSGDECLAGKSPIQGTELCAVAEYMYSLEVLLSVIGNPAFGDRLEKIAFNALPATFSPDMWSHQYDQQVNQVECSIKENRVWNTNGDDANIFGLEPNFGCCTANFSQAWPKFAAHLWMKTEDDGLSALAYAPCTVTTNLGGAKVKAELQTDYPFRDRLRFKINVDRPVCFPLLLRIPGWATGAVLKMPDEGADNVESGSFHRIDRQWEGETRFSLVLPMKPSVSRRFNDAVAIERGPLVYSLRIGEDWKRINPDKPHRELPHADWEIHPNTPWNYGLAVSEQGRQNELEFEEKPIGNCPFSPDHAPVTATVKGRLLPEWKLEDGSAGPVPDSPVKSSEPVQMLTLIPYGCTNLRITEFPVLEPETPK